MNLMKFEEYEVDCRIHPYYKNGRSGNDWMLPKSQQISVIG